MRSIEDLHPYQRAGVRHVIDNPHCGLFLEMGLGKTVVSLTAFKSLYDTLEANRVLVIAPKRVAESVWSAELEEWAHLQGLRISKIAGDEKRRVLAMQVRAEIYTVSRDNVEWLVKRIGKGKPPWDMLIVDELSSFKNSDTKRFKALKKIQPYFDRVVGLTGTPAPNGLLDIWAQMYLIDRGERLGKTLTNYRDKYFKPDKRNGAIVYSYKLLPFAEETIHGLIGDVCMSMKAKDYLDLPGRVEREVKLEMDQRTYESYLAFEKEQVMALDGVEITALNAAGLSNKLLQFANGVMYDQDGVSHEVHSHKLDALEEIIEEAQGESVLVAWTYRHDRDRILKRLAKYKPVELKGDAEIKRWNKGEIRVMLMHPASGGHGLNLQAGGRVIVWYGQTWSLELDMQFNARLDRQGQTRAVIIHRLVMARTVDEEVVEAIKRKESGQEALMRAVKAKIEKYFSKKE